MHLIIPPDIINEMLQHVTGYHGGQSKSVADKREEGWFALNSTVGHPTV